MKHPAPSVPSEQPVRGPVPTEAPTALSLYDRARQALAEARTVPAAKDTLNITEQLKLYARQAQDKEMLADVTELALQAERHLGALLLAADEAGELSRGGRPKKSSSPPSGRGRPVGGPETGSGGEPVFGKATLKEAGISKKLSMTAQKLARLPAAGFDNYLRATREKILGGRAIIINPAKDLSTAEKAIKRRIKEAQLAARQKALPDKKYGVILEDPEWQFATYSPAGLDRAADNHYPTSPTAAIIARPVGALAADDCVLFLWTTVPMLLDGLEVLKARGFRYVTHFIWDKVEQGTGYWNRNQHELLLVGTRGSIPAPAPGTQRPSIMVQRATSHSTKPEWAYAMIEEFYPNLPKIELNARRRRDGWDAWGFEAPELNPSPSGEDANRLGDPAPTDPLHQESRAKPVDEAVAGRAMSEVAAVAASPETAETGSRPDAGRSASATSERMEATAGETAQAGEGTAFPSPADPLHAAYLGAVAAAAGHFGVHTRETAQPVLRAAYACDPIVPVARIAADLGAKRNTVLSWVFRLKLSQHGRGFAALKKSGHAPAEVA